MELTTVSQQVVHNHEVEHKINNKFIEANTKEVSHFHLRNECIIPVFAKDNESTIAHYEFIEAVHSAAKEAFSEEVSLPSIRTSHQIKGRIPSAIGKPAKELLDHEKTIYWERMAFMIEIPQIYIIINNQKLTLTIGGVRSYHEQNLFAKKSIEKFKVFIGFKNTVCTNLCISSDGLINDLRVSNTEELKSRVFSLIEEYNQELHIQRMKQMLDYKLSEIEFAHLIGKMKLYHHLDKSKKKELFNLQVTDSQINTIVKDYITDDNFKRDSDCTISLWNAYNLFTEASKSNYIDNFLSRNCNAYEFINTLGNSLEFKQTNFFLPQYNIAI